MPEVQTDLIIGIGESQANLRIISQMMNELNSSIKKTNAQSQESFDNVNKKVQNTNTSLGKSIGIITQLKNKIADLRQAREFATTTAEVNKLTEEIRGAETQVKQLEGTLDAFGKRQGRGINEITENFFTLGQGLIGVTNLIGILGDKGEEENQALIAATRLLVLAESARSVVVGFLKAQELASLLVSKLQTASNIEQAVTTKAATAAVDEQAISYAVLAGAKREDIVETDAQALAYLELAGATETQAAATKSAEVATTKFNLALLANPYVLIAAGILAVVAALVLFGDESGRVTQEILDDTQRQIDLENSLAESRQKSLQAQLDFLKKTGQIRESAASRQAEEVAFAEEQKRIEREKNQALLKEQKDFQDKSNGLRAQGILEFFVPSPVPGLEKTPIIGPSEKEQAKHNQIIAGITADFNAKLEAAQDTHNFKMKALVIDGNKEQLEEDLKLAGLRIAIIGDETTRAIEARKLQAKQEIEALLPEETLRAEKIKLIHEKEAKDILAIQEKASRDAIDLLIKQADAERALHQRVLDAQAELGTNREKLIADQSKARQDLEIEQAKLGLARQREIEDEARKKGLDPKDEKVLKEIADAKLKIDNEFQKIFDAQDIAFGIARTKLEQSDAKTRLALLQDSLEKRLQEFDLNAAEERDKQIKAGADAIDVDKAIVKSRLDVITAYQNERIDIQNQAHKNELEATINTAKLSDEAIKKIRIQQLEGDREAAKQKLELALFVAVATGDLSDKNLKQIQDLRSAINQIGNDINQVKASIKPINWADIFGVGADFADQFNQAVESIFAQANQIWQQAVEHDIAVNDQLIESNQKVIDSLNERIKETEAALKDEEELFRRGFASNVDLKKSEIAKLKAEREKELADQKKLQAERIKLAQEQQRIDALTTASSIIVAGAQLIKSWATLPFGVGLALAFAQVAAIIAFIGSLQSKAAQVASSGPGFREGGYTGDGYPTEVAGDVHKKEFVFTEEKTAEYRTIFEKLHKDQPLSNKDLAKLLEGSGIAIPEEEKKSIMGDRIMIMDHEEKSKVEDNTMMRKKMNELIEKTESIQKEIKNRPFTYQEPDGSTVIIKGDHKKTIRKSP